MKNTFEQCFYTVAVILLLTMFTPSVYADVTATGDVDPGDPSLWDYYYNGYIGKITNGTLTVTDGSQIYGDNNGYIGYDSGSTGQVTIDGADSFWRNDNCFYVGYSGNGVLDITDGGKIRSNYYSGDAISAIGYNLGSLGQVTVDGVGSEWNTEELFYVGYSGNGMLNITNGGKVSNGNDNTHFGGGGIGYNSGSTGQVTVNGIGSLWDIRDSSAIVGLSGNGTLNITNGGQVNSIGGRIGNGSGSTGQVTVDGAGSIWHSASNLAPDFCVGYSGNGTLNITNGGQVNSGYADSYISYDSGSTGEVFVNGADSKWTGGHLFVGFFGNGLLEIANGGQVDSGGISIGDFGHYSGYRSTGQVIVDGADSELNAGRIDVGKSGNGTLAITRGGRVNGYDGSIARESGSTGQVTVDGVGSIWSMEGDLVIGDNDNYTSSPYYTNGGNGTLNIINGGQVNSSWGGASIGQGRNSVGKVTVDGVDSEWSIQHLLRIANGENSNGTLNITNGSQVSSEGGEIGYGFGTTGQVTVDGIGSAWNQGDLGLCLGGGGNGTLTITNGGYVSSGNGRIGDGRIGNDDGSAGSVTVDGAGSKWVSDRAIRIGGNQAEGILEITNGGQVSSSGGDINSSLAAVVTVDGVGSEWTNSGDFTIGDSKNGTLNITNGGQVLTTNFINGHSTIGHDSGAMGEVTVDGYGSKWFSYYIAVGHEGSGILNITNNGLVEAYALYIDNNGDGDSFIDMSTGGMLALYGEADNSIADFLAMINGTDAIRYWDDSILDWADITGATYGLDYTLDYLTEGDLSGFTVLTVPEPCVLLLLSLGGLMIRKRK